MLDLINIYLSNVRPDLVWLCESNRRFSFSVDFDVSKIGLWRVFPGEPRIFAAVKRMRYFPVLTVAKVSIAYINLGHANKNILHILFVNFIITNECQYIVSVCNYAAEKQSS